MFFSQEEYVARWAKVQAAMQDRGYENLIVWQRSAGTYDRVGDVYWLTNFKANGTGQDPASEEYCAPFTFAAVLFRKGREPELHFGMPDDELALAVDPSTVVCGKLVTHEKGLMRGLSEYLAREGIEGRVAVVGDDVLPGMYDRILRRHTLQIQWVSDETFLYEPQSVKSPRELEAFRTAGEIITKALTSAMEAMIGGKTAARAAAGAAEIIIGAGGGFHRIDINHGPASERLILSNDLYGYSAKAAAPGDFIRIWIYGPIFEGYWLDPGRTAICGNQPTAAQKALIDATVEIVDRIVDAAVPGRTLQEVGVIGAEVAKKICAADHELGSHLFGHGLSTNFSGQTIPVGDQPPSWDLPTTDLPIAPGMVLASEAFLTHPGIGLA
ncbi:MAG: M24 family metallopeptidase, partial [Candidatus Binatia bacterium]